jgi:hypothetical protein
VRAFELVRQEYEHAEGRNRVLFTVGTVFYDDGVPYVFDTASSRVSALPWTSGMVETLSVAG